jgi:hypothetical protein
MHWLLTDGGSSLAEHTRIHMSALMLAAYKGRFPAMQWLLEQGAVLSDSDTFGRTVWSELYLDCRDFESAAELSSLLKIMVVLDDAPGDFIARLSPRHAEICTWGRHLRAQLPSYLERQRAAVIAHWPLPAVLQYLVAVYAVTTAEDMWANRLRVQAPRAKRGRTKAEKQDEDAPPLRRSLRLRQKSASLDDD